MYILKCNTKRRHPRLVLSPWIVLKASQDAVALTLIITAIQYRALKNDHNGNKKLHSTLNTFSSTSQLCDPAPLIYGVIIDKCSKSQFTVHY